MNGWIDWVSISPLFVLNYLNFVKLKEKSIKNYEEQFKVFRGHIYIGWLKHTAGFLKSVRWLCAEGWIGSEDI